jgi:hypothetical protein
MFAYKAICDLKSLGTVETVVTIGFLEAVRIEYKPEHKPRSVADELVNSRFPS